MIEDALAARKATLSAGGEQLSVAGLKRPADALAVSRQIQLLLQGFRSQSRGEPVGLSIAIDSQTTSANVDRLPGASTKVSPGLDDHDAQPSHDLLSLLKISKPAQILVTHEMSQEIGAYKGLPLRSFPGRFGVSEYLWTSAEDLALLQSEPQLTLATVPDPPQKPAAADPPQMPEPDHQTPADEVSSPFPIRPLKIFEPAGSTSWRDPRRAGAAAAAVLVFSFGLWGLYGAFRWAMKGPAPTRPAVSTTQSQIQTPPPGTKVLSPPARPSATTAKTRAAAFKNADKGSGSPEHPVSTPAAAGQERARGCALESNEIPWYLQKAEESRQQGQYDRAIHLYQMFLSCEPNNPAALAGIAKAKAALGDGE